MAADTAKNSSEGRNKSAFTIAAILLVALICAGIAALGVRIMDRAKPAPSGAALRTSPVNYVNRDGFYTYPANNISHFENENGTKVEIKTDELGFRNPPGALEKSDTIILGDSFIMAINTPAEQTFAARLNSLGVASYNAGMDGFSTLQAAAALKWLLSQKKSPTRHIILAFYLGNDFRDNFCQANPACDTGGRVARIKNLGHAPSEIMASYPLGEMAMLRKTPPQSATEAAEKTAAAIKDIANTASSAGAELIILAIPSKAQTLQSFYEISSFAADPRAEQYALVSIRSGFSFDRPNDTLYDTAKTVGAKFVPLLPVFRSHPVSQSYFSIDHHWNLAGQSAAADAVLKFIY